MSWYKRIHIADDMPLDPDAWQYYNPDQSHRLEKDKPLVRSPFGNRMVYQPQKQEDIESKYRGVHGTQDFDLACMYANNFASPQDHPVVLQFTTHQQIHKDIDANTKDYDNLYEIISENNNANRVASLPFNKRQVENLMEELSNYDNMNYENEEIRNIDENIFQTAQNDHPNAIISYFRDQYKDRAAFFFYRDFLVPLINQGIVKDERWKTYVINQVRFHESVSDDQIIAVYQITPWKDLSNTRGGYNIEDENKEFPGYEVADIHEDFEFSPTRKQVWRTNNPYLFEFPSYYHGTTASRAKTALPTLARVFDSMMGGTITDQPKMAISWYGRRKND